jgi:hypothetical protein
MKVDRLCGLVVRAPGYITEMCCVSCDIRTQFIYVYVEESRPPLLSSGQEFLATDSEVRVRFLALPHFLSSSGSGTGSTQPREYN